MFTCGALTPSNAERICRRNGLVSILISVVHAGLAGTEACLDSRESSRQRMEKASSLDRNEVKKYDLAAVLSLIELLNIYRFAFFRIEITSRSRTRICVLLNINVEELKYE